MEHVLICLGADIHGDEDVRPGCRRGLAPRQKIGPGTADGVFDGVGYEGGEDEGDGEGEVRDLVFVGRRAADEVPEDEDAEGNEEGEDEVHGCVRR